MSEEYKILIVDDEPDILEFLEYNLTKKGYRVSTAEHGQDALDQMDIETPHLVLLDRMMPVMDGLETCQKIRNIEKFNDVLVAFLTAKSEELSQISGLDAGADDYIPKPIKPKLLLSRVAALLRRLPENINDISQIAEGLVIDRTQYQVTKHGRVIVLPKKEFELLCLLSGKPGKVFSREKIYKNIWGQDLIVGVRTIDVHIRKLREKIGDNYITTIKGVGYKFEE